VRFELTVHFYTTVFKTVAINRTLPHFLYLEQRAGFEPAVLGICSPLHWAALPPLHFLAYPQRLELRRTVLETVMLPLHQGYIVGGEYWDRTSHV
jgi:hypothetical protein